MRFAGGEGLAVPGAGRAKDDAPFRGEEVTEGQFRVNERVSRDQFATLTTPTPALARVGPFLVASFHGTAGLARSRNHRGLGTDFFASG